MNPIKQLCNKISDTLLFVFIVPLMVMDVLWFDLKAWYSKRNK